MIVYTGRMLTECFAYLEDNPKGYWFKAKLYGVGWVPATWQGWCVTGAYLVCILGFVSFREKDIPGNPESGSNILTFGLPVIVLTMLFVAIAYKTGEKLRWQWGLPKKR